LPWPIWRTFIIGRLLAIFFGSALAELGPHDAFAQWRSDSPALNIRNVVRTAPLKSRCNRLEIKEPFKEIRRADRTKDAGAAPPAP
jgi:hypothetical protein